MSYQDTIGSFTRGGGLLIGGIVLVVVGLVAAVFTFGGLANIVLYQDVATGVMNLVVAAVLVGIIYGVVRLGNREKRAD